MQVIIFDPQYDAYIPLCVAGGGVPIAVKLDTEDWSVPHAGTHSPPVAGPFGSCCCRGSCLKPLLISSVMSINQYWLAELEAAFSERTKAILVNSPHNPTGKVFSSEDLRFIADLCKKWNVYAILDEVSCTAAGLTLL